MNWRTKLIIAFCLGLAITSCKPDDDLSDIPVLESRSFDVFRAQNRADSASWTLGFSDGDGDFGFIGDPDTLNTNLFLNAFKIINGVESEVVGFSNDYNIPLIDGVNTSRGTTGKLEISIQLNIYLDRGYDTMRIEGFILDRALNKSNIVSSPLIWLN